MLQLLLLVTLDHKTPSSLSFNLSRFFVAFLSFLIKVVRGRPKSLAFALFETLNFGSVSRGCGCVLGVVSGVAEVATSNASTAPL